MSKRTHIKNKTWWIEYVENEMSDSTKEAIELLLRHSLTDSSIVTNFRLLRQNIKSSDPTNEFAAHINDDKKMANLTDKIMSEVKNTKIQDKTKWDSNEDGKLTFL